MAIDLFGRLVLTGLKWQPQKKRSQSGITCLSSVCLFSDFYFIVSPLTSVGQLSVCFSLTRLEEETQNY